MRTQFTGVSENQFDINDTKIQICDVGGQKNEKRKWIHFFDCVTAVIFVVSLNSYNELIPVSSDFMTTGNNNNIAGFIQTQTQGTEYDLSNTGIETQKTKSQTQETGSRISDTHTNHTKTISNENQNSQKIQRFSLSNNTANAMQESLQLFYEYLHSHWSNIALFFCFFFVFCFLFFCFFVFLFFALLRCHQKWLTRTPKCTHTQSVGICNM